MLKAKEIPVEVLRQTKTSKSEEIIPFTMTYNPKNLNGFPAKNKALITCSILKQCPTFFRNRNLLKSLSQTLRLGRLLCRCKYESQHKNHEVKHCGKNCVSCPYLLKASLYQFKWVNKSFFLKNSFNCESRNLIYVVFCERCKEEYLEETGCLVKEQRNIYRQQIRQS